MQPFLTISLFFTNVTFAQMNKLLPFWGVRHGRAVRFTTTCAISTCHHYSCEVEPRSWRSVLDTTLCNTGRWFSPGTSVSSSNKADCHYIAKILLKVALSAITSWHWWQHHMCFLSRNYNIHSDGWRRSRMTKLSLFVQKCQILKWTIQSSGLTLLAHGLKRFGNPLSPDQNSLSLIES